VDIYMPDFKYWDADMAEKYSAGARSYPGTTRQAILEMYRQVGRARYAPGGIMQRGLIIRHLVLPDNIAGSADILAWIAGHLPLDTYVNIMAQYHPDYRASDHVELSRMISAREYESVVDTARSLGLVNLDVQTFVPHLR
jgi:putative pyruvate formate lyase activating enzyme